MSKSEVGSSVIRTVLHSCVEGRLIQVHHAVDSRGEKKFGINGNKRHSRCLNYGFSLSKCFNAKNLQLGDGLSFQGRQQPPSTEEAVLNNSQALQDVVAGRKKEKTHTYDQDLFTYSLKKGQTHVQCATECEQSCCSFSPGQVLLSLREPLQALKFWLENHFQ